MKTYGFIIESSIDYGTTYIKARVVCRESGKDSPLGASDWNLGDSDSPKNLCGLTLDGLTLRGFVSDSGEPHFLLHDPEYTDCFSVDFGKARRMAKTLAKVTKKISDSRAHEPGDVFTAFAAALKLTFVVERTGQRRGSSYSDSDWQWRTIEDGRNRFRQLIEKAVTDEKLRKVS